MALMAQPPAAALAPRMFAVAPRPPAVRQSRRAALGLLPYSVQTTTPRPS